MVTGYGYGKWFVDVKDCFILLFPILYPVTLYHVKGMPQHLRQIHGQMKVQTIVAINRRTKLVGFRFREIYFTRDVRKTTWVVGISQAKGDNNKRLSQPTIGVIRLDRCKN